MLSVAVWIWVTAIFLLGAAVGSFLNACACRLPYEKSVLWPGSHCFRCLQPIRWYDNLPLVSYWVLRGRCRRCGQTFSARYFLVELFVGLAFAGLFYLEIFRNVMNVPLLRPDHLGWQIEWGVIPLRAWVLFGCHATLMSFLIVASLCDLEHLEIPLSVTVTGTLVGLALSTAFPWPYPEDRWAPTPLERHFHEKAGLPPQPPAGVQAWPVWQPLPSWLPAGSWRLGLVNGLAGAVAGSLMLRGVRFLFSVGRGIEGIGLGDADVMMMAGAFLGWQPVVIAFFLAVFPALVFGLAQIALKGNQTMPFGPSLAVGAMLALLLWPWLGAYFLLLFFQAWVVGLLTAAGAVILLVLAFALRLMRGHPDEAEEKKATSA
jgi:leader peptidase (prepilin peptidase)/N-methyltransferase